MEILVAVGLLAVITVGLLAMFYQTQRAFRSGVNQVDVMESGRTVTQLLSRELQQLTASGDTNFASLDADVGVGVVPLVQPLPGGELRTNAVMNVRFLRKENDDWIETAYTVARVQDSPVGTLYRFVDRQRVMSALNAFNRDPQRVIDGVVNFQVIASDQNGIVVYTNTPTVLAQPGQYIFRGDKLPSYLDVELGIVETTTLKRYEARTNTMAQANAYLEDQAGKVHIFRQRLPIRTAL